MTTAQHSAIRGVMVFCWQLSQEHRFDPQGQSKVDLVGRSEWEWLTSATPTSLFGDV